MPTNPVSANLPLSVILPFFSSSVLSHSSFSQLSIFVRSLRQDYTTVLCQKQSSMRGALGERLCTSDTGRWTLFSEESFCEF